jgi:hypothetical protein
MSISVSEESCPLRRAQSNAHTNSNSSCGGPRAIQISIGGNLDKTNLNLKQFLKINLLQKYFIWLTLFSRAIHGGAAVKRATPLSVARLGEPRRNRLPGGARVA